MKTSVATVILSVAASVLFAVSSAAESGSDTLKVMTYNLRFGELASMEEIAEFISSENPDLVALQECDWDTARERAPKQNGVKFINELAYRTGMFGIYGKSIDYKGGYYGVAILSRYPVTRMERIPLPNPDHREQRIMLVTEVEMPEGRSVKFICTHLEVSSSDARIQQVDFINGRLDGDGPVLLAGDMNSTPDSPEMRQLMSRWKNLTNDGLTYSSSHPQIKIDYIVGYPSEDIELISTEVRTGVMLSDHFPVVSEIAIKR